MRDSESRAGWTGRVARLGSSGGFVGIGGEGSVARIGLGSRFGEMGGKGSAMSDKYGAAVSKSGEMRAEAITGLEDRVDWTSAWRASGEGCA